MGLVAYKPNVMVSAYIHDEWGSNTTPGKQNIPPVGCDACSSNLRRDKNRPSNIAYLVM